MRGQLIYLVGPSGSGKDSILRELALLLPNQCVVMKRVVTRDNSLPLDDEESLSQSEFNRLESASEFALCWRANGLGYGIRKELDQHLQNGKLVLVNGSREYWSEVVQRYPQAILVLIQVDSTLLGKRLLARGRETVEEIQLRLTRNALIEQTLNHQVKDSNAVLWVIDNSGALSDAVESLYRKLKDLVSA